MFGRGKKAAGAAKKVDYYVARFSPRSDITAFELASLFGALDGSLAAGVYIKVDDYESTKQTLGEAMRHLVIVDMIDVSELPL